MKALLEEYGLGLCLALALHGALACSMLLSMNMATPEGGAPMMAEIEPMNAVMLDESKVQAEIERLDFQEKTTKELLETEQEQFKAETIKALQLKEDAEKALKAITEAKALEESSLAELQIKQEKAHKELKALQEKQKKEMTRLEEEATRDSIENKEQQKVAALDKKKTQEKARKAEEDKKAAAKKKAELDAKTLASKNQAAKAAREQHLKFVDSEVARLKAEMTERIRSHKQIIFGLASDLTATVHFRVLPDGSVVDAKIIQSSGHMAYDSTAINAVLKAAPYAVSSDLAIMNEFKSINLKVKNED